MTRNVYLGDLHERPGVFRLWERQRNRREVHWLIECFAETLGVFLYVFPGVGSTLGFILGGITNQAGVSSIFQIGFAYALGILFALGIAAGTSGGHFHPGVTIVHVIFRGFPVSKAFRYIVAQIFGGYLACMLVYYQWRPFVHEMVDGLAAAGEEALMFTPNGPPGAFALYLPPGMTLGSIFLNEFVCSFFVGLVIWAAGDPTNIVITPALGAPCVALAYAAAIWSFAVPGIALNSARDVGGRLWAMSIWGLKAGGGKYAAIAALTNIPATIFAVAFYEIFLVDSDRLVTSQASEFARLVHGNRRLVSKDAPLAPDASTIERGRQSNHDSGKASIDAFEVAPETQQRR
ncbi:hypothetical protein D9756_003402 [Leucocoprinus leucothites]|uniref:Aquaporin-like protein n=1 Tax=Leucocoprinus leucothites TaxID=201217 RepID=A0A8H5G7E5_9AGAR|nr:hypothetical protein D9756_003402 [Leucoagaricus leucothites]